MARKKPTQRRTPLIAIIISLLFASFLIVNRFYRTQIQGVETNMSAAEIMSVVNAVRQQHGLEPLHPKEALIKAAEAKANAMLEANTWSHNTPTQTPWQFIDSEQYVYSLAGENLAKDFNRAEDVVEAWMNSPSHRQNLLSAEFTDTGIAVIEGSYQNKENTTLVVQFLAKEYVVANNNDDVESVFIETPILIKQMNQVPPLLFIVLSTVTFIIFIGLALFISLRKTKLPKTPNAFHWRH